MIELHVIAALLFLLLITSILGVILIIRLLTDIASATEAIFDRVASISEAALHRKYRDACADHPGGCVPDLIDQETFKSVPSRDMSGSNCPAGVR